MNNTTTAIITYTENGKVLYKHTLPSLLFGFGCDSGHHSMFRKRKNGDIFWRI
jgi:hypothetical protein